MNDLVVAASDVIFHEDLLHDMRSFGELGYPEEVVGFLFGIAQQEKTTFHHLSRVENHQEAEARRRRYLVSPDDWSRSETEAKRLQLDVVGVFHTHPDHPARPSRVDLEFALPNLVYVIMAVHQREVVDIRAWRLREDRAQFDECVLELL